MSVVKQEKLVKASPEEVYRYFTNSTFLKDWMCEVATADPHPGGHLYMGWPGEYYTAGEYISLESNKSVSFTWFGRGEPHKTRVDVTFKKVKGGTHIRLIHRGLGKSPKWSGIADGYAHEWQNSLENLASVLETGADLRITRRPMLGIYLGDFDASIATKLGCPVDYGSRLDGVLDGMGAKLAGLQKDDVIVAIDGSELKADSTLTSILGHKHAGDVVEVTFYRGSEKRVVNMTLSGRLLPVIPATSSEFARQIADQYHHYETEIETMIIGSNDAECSRKPAPGEWSANEILAHLIHGEQGWLNYASDIVGGSEPAYEGYSGNLEARIDATTELYSNTDELFSALKSRNAETVSFFRHLQVDFPSQRGRWWKLVYAASQNPYHMDGHLDQMRRAIQAAKNT